MPAQKAACVYGGAPQVAAAFAAAPLGCFAQLPAGCCPIEDVTQLALNSTRNACRTLT
jgi:hypothetical protein